MPQLKLHDVWVQFPFIPYRPQEVFMGHLISCLNNGTNALLESPTGTGKTLCLLCASCGWLDARRRDEELEYYMEARITKPLQYENRQKIFFCSRTHSQLQQAIHEFQSTNYGHLRAAFLSSRKNLCIHEKVKHDKNLDNKCSALRRTTSCTAVPPVDIEDVPAKCTSCQRDHPCPFYINFQKMVSDHEEKVFTEVGVLGHRQLQKKCKELKICPFYMARHLAKRADIIFLPYSYVFNRHIFKSLKTEMKDCIIIVDEGHNIERVCEENASVDIKDQYLNDCLQELSYVKANFGEEGFPEDVRMEDVTRLQDIVARIRNSINDLEEGTYFGGDVIVLKFWNGGLTSGNMSRHIHNMRQLMNFCGERDFACDGMRNFISIAEIVLQHDDDLSEMDPQKYLEEMKLSFTVYVDPPVNEEPKPRITHFWCFNAAIVMRSIMRKKVLSMIVTSGTLSPLEPLALSLGIPFPIKEANKHVIDAVQALGLQVRSGLHDILLNSSHAYRNQVGHKYYIDVGLAILTIAEATPGGLLIFFQSKSIRKECLDVWTDFEIAEGKSLFEVLNEEKLIFEEPEFSTDLPDLQRLYYAEVDRDGSNGACLIGIMSGKVSEGLDFKNRYGRAVVMVGLPYPPCDDAWVKRKRDIGGDEWYRTAATRSVNQGIGRVIRHRTDYGAIILLDERFLETLRSEVYYDLPKWLRRNLQRCTHDELGCLLRHFFETIENKVDSIKDRVAHEQELTSERYQRDLLGEEVSAMEFNKLQAEIEMHKSNQLSLLKRVSDLRNDLHDLQREVSIDQEKLKRQEEIASAFFVKEDIKNENGDSDDDWRSDGKSDWDGLNLESKL